MILSSDTAALTAVYQPLHLQAIQGLRAPPLTWDQLLVFQLVAAQLEINRLRCKHPRFYLHRTGLVCCVACNGVNHDAT